MTTTIALEIVCPNCGCITRIPDWPRLRREPFAFTCVRPQGCGGHAYVEPPDLRGFSHLAVAIVTAQPLTPRQYHSATSKGTPQ